MCPSAILFFRAWRPRVGSQFPRSGNSGGLLPKHESRSSLTFSHNFDSIGCEPFHRVHDSHSSCSISVGVKSNGLQQTSSVSICQSGHWPFQKDLNHGAQSSDRVLMSHIYGISLNRFFAGFAHHRRPFPFSCNAVIDKASFFFLLLALQVFGLRTAN